MITCVSLREVVKFVGKCTLQLPLEPGEFSDAAIMHPHQLGEMPWVTVVLRE